MSTSVPPPPPPPSSPPPPSGRRSRLGWYVAGAVLALVLATGGAVIALTGGDATSVEEVADQAVEAAEDLDVGAGIDLLCSAPTDEQRRELEDLIDEGRDATGDDAPEIDYEISDVSDGAAGSFRVRASSDEPELEGKELDVVVLVEEDGDRSCIAGIEDGESVGEDGD